MCVFVCVRVCVQIKGTVRERYWQGCALSSLSDMVVLSYVSKVVVDDTGLKAV